MYHYNMIYGAALKLENQVLFKTFGWGGILHDYP